VIERSLHDLVHKHIFLKLLAKLVKRDEMLLQKKTELYYSVFPRCRLKISNALSES
jgi:hypothetical protein